MSSIFLYGNFALGDGASHITQRPANAANQRPTTHHVYPTCISLPHGLAVNALLRVFAAASARILPKDTVINALVTALLAANGEWLLEAIWFTTFPGDPASDNYDDNIFDMPSTIYIGTGPVRSAVMDLGDGQRAFNQEVFGFVRGLNQPSMVRPIFKADRRWANTPVPGLNSSVQVVGFCDRVFNDGVLGVVVTDITYNIGQVGLPSVPTTGPSSGTNGPPAKKRKYQSSVANAVVTAPKSGGTSASSSGTSAQGQFSTQTFGPPVPQGMQTMQFAASAMPAVPIPSTPNANAFGTYSYPEMGPPSMGGGQSQSFSTAPIGHVASAAPSPQTQSSVDMHAMSQFMNSRDTNINMSSDEQGNQAMLSPAFNMSTHMGSDGMQNMNMMNGAGPSSHPFGQMFSNFQLGSSNPGPSSTPQNPQCGPSVSPLSPVPESAAAEPAGRTTRKSAKGKGKAKEVGEGGN